MALDQRSVKTTMGLERLSCTSPAMTINEMRVYPLARKPIRLMVPQSAAPADCLPWQLNVKQTVRIWLTWCCRGFGE